MKIFGPDYIDYWQKVSAQRGLKNRFGVRVLDGRCWALVKIGDEPASTFGKAQKIPVDLEIIPDYFRVIIEEHSSSPNSDLLEVLSGAKSFQDALRSPKIELKRIERRRTTRDGSETHTETW